MTVTPPQQQPAPPTPPAKPNWPLAILLLTAASGPFAAGIAFAEQVEKHPWRAAGLALLYWFVLGVFGFLTKVWEKLQTRWVEKAADWVDMRLQAILSGYRRRYLQHLRYRHRDFDVKGLSTQGIFTLELERVFVELTVVPRPPHKTSADPIRQMPPKLREGRHTIWDYLRSEILADRGLAVIGPPGSGKTTLLKHMALTLIGRRKLRKRHDAPAKLPILLFLRDHAQAIRDVPDLSLAQAVQDGLTRQGGPQAPPGWFRRQLERGHCLVMLDGLDEVADDTRKHVADWVERQMGACSGNRFVATSRPHGYRATPLTNVAVLEVAPFDRDQTRRFIDNWYLANEVMSAQKDDPGVRMKAREGANDLLRRIWGSPALAALAVNPLLLTMISNVHRYRSSLPGRRVELYAEICEVFMGKRQAAKGVAEDLTPVQKRCVLQPLAYYMMQEEQREIPLARATKVITATLARVGPNIPSEDFLKMVENSSGLLVERESGVYGFAHKTFQEYLASIHIQEARLENRLLKQVENTWWHETIRLYCAQADATPVIQTCLKEDPPSIPALMLAIECLDEAREVQPKVRTRLESVLNEGVEDEDLERRYIVAEALLSLRLQRMVRVSEDRYVDPAPITHVEYQLFLDEQRAQGKYHQPDHWPDSQFPRGAGRAPVVGVRFSDAVALCEWLTQREAGPWRCRLPSQEELECTVRAGSETTTVSGIAYWCMLEEQGIQKPVISSIPAADLDIKLESRIDADLDLALAVDVALAQTDIVDEWRFNARDQASARACRLFSEFDGPHTFNLRPAELPIEPLVRQGVDIDNGRALLNYVLSRSSHLPSRTTSSSDREQSYLAFVTQFITVANLILDRNREPRRVLNLGIADAALAIIRHLDAPNLQIDQAINAPPTLGDALPLVRTRVRNLDVEVDLESPYSFGRWFIRVWSLSFANIIWQTVRHPVEQRVGSFQTDALQAAQIFMRYFLDLYIDLAILEARIQGELPAFEGIRIVRERIKDEETDV